MRLISDSIENKKNIVYINKIKDININDIFHIYDVFEIDEICTLFDIKGKPAALISDHIIHYDNFINNIKFAGLPLYLEHERMKWNRDEFTDWEYKTNNCFNFMINKKQVNRYLCIKLVELYKLQNFTYTWSGADKHFDCADIINEHQNLGKLSPLSSEQFAEILSPIKLEPFFYSDAPGKIMKNNGHGGKEDGGNRKNWNWGLDKMFSESAVSLITESLSFQKASTFTEKTLYSVLGASFPIWVGGGNKQEEMWKKIGFDTFDDIINHDYQYYDTLLERCVYAFILNKKILTDLDFAKSVRNRNMDRLINNRDLILSGKLTEYIYLEIKKHFPGNIPLGIHEILEHFNIDNC